MHLEEEMKILFSGRTFLYHLFQNIFGNEPSIKQLDIVTDDETPLLLGLFLTENDNRVVEAMNRLNAFSVEYRQDKDKMVGQLDREYTKLFIGPGKLPAYPWESVYVSKEPLLFQESTLKVRNWYLNHHFIPTEYPHVADDHLSLELDFMAQLSSRAEMAYRQKELEVVARLLADQKQFLQEHMLVWVPKFSSRIQEADSSDFYPTAAVLLTEVLKVDLEAIDELLNALKVQASKMMVDAY